MVAQGVSPGNTDVIQEPLEGRKNALPPLPGALLLDSAFPGLTPWAAISRPDGLNFAFRKYLLSLEKAGDGAACGYAQCYPDV